MPGQRLNIAFLYNFADFSGGGEVSTAEMIRSLPSARVNPVIFVPGPGEVQEHFKAQGVATVICPQPGLRSPKVHRPFQAVAKLMREIRRHSIDIVHTAGTRGCLYGGIAGRLTGPPVVWHVRESLQDMYGYDRLLSGLATRLFCVSDAVSDKRFTRFGQNILSKCRTVHNAVDTAKFKHDLQARLRQRKEWGIAPDAVVAGLVGNIIHRKGHDTLLTALKKVQSPVTIVCAGHGGMELEFEKRVKAEAGANVHFVPFSRDLTALYSALDILLLPSRSEGFSRALIEGMSFGLPVIASDIPEIREAVPNAQNALLHEPEDAAALTKALERMGEDPQLRQSMGEANRKRAKEYFSLGAHGEQVAELYGEMLATPRRTLRSFAKVMYLGLRKAALLPLALKRRPRPKAIKSILCIAPPRLGDSIMALHAVAQVRHAMPQATIHVFSSNYTASVMELSPHADRVLSDITNTYDLTIDLNAEWRLETTRLAKRTSHYCIGFDVAGRGPMYDAALPGPSTVLPMKDSYTELVQLSVGGDGCKGSLVSLPPCKVELPSRPYAVLSPGATHPSQCWLPEHFAKTADEMMESGLAVVLLGIPSEAPLLEEVQNHMRSTPTLVSTEKSILKLATYLQNAHIFIGNNSGPLHVAGCVGIPTVSFRGPTLDVRWGPVGPADTVLERSELPCLGCSKPLCPRGDHACMRRIKPDTVVATALAAIGQGGSNA